MHSLAVVLLVGLFGCSHTNGFFNDRTMPNPSLESDPCPSCGGSANVLEIGVATTVLLAGVVLAKLSR